MKISNNSNASYKNRGLDGSRSSQTSTRAESTPVDTFQRTNDSKVTEIKLPPTKLQETGRKLGAVALGAFGLASAIAGAALGPGGLLLGFAVGTILVTQASMTFTGEGPQPPTPSPPNAG
jgi:hypothetical protein